MKPDILRKLEENFSGRIKELRVHSEKRLYLSVGKEDLLPVAEFIFNSLNARFVTASAVDNLENMEIVYHFSLDKEDVMISLRVVLPRDNPVCPTLSGVVKAAAWIEREMHELFGIQFLQHPGLKHLLLPEDWPAGVYPLRKESPSCPEKGKK